LLFELKADHLDHFGRLIGGSGRAPMAVAAEQATALMPERPES
jgi:hypothetical protein